MTKKSSLTFMACFVSFLGYFGGTIYIAALPELSQVFQVSTAFIKFSITIYFIGLILGTVLSSLFSEIYGRMKALTFFLSLSFVSGLMCGFSLTMPWFLAGRLLEGIGHAGGPILIMAIIADHFEGVAYHRLISFVIVMTSLGPGIAPIFGSVILQFFDWRVIFYILAALEALALGLWLYIKIEPVVVRRKITETFQEYIFFLRHPFFKYYCLVIGSLYGAFYAFLVISPYIFRLHYGWDIIDFVWVGLALAVANSLGSILNKELVDKIGCHKIFLIGIAIIITAFFLLLTIGLPSHGTWLLLMISLFVIGDNLISSCLTADAVKLGAQYTSIAASLINLSKCIIVAFILFLVLFLPATLVTVNYFILGSILICIFGYLKIRTVL